MRNKEKPTFSITDHVCRFCKGGRILEQETPSVITGGGNPMYQCSECGKRGSSMGTGVLCWCGFTHKNQYDPAYQCVSVSYLKDRKASSNLFYSHGYDPDCKAEIIVLPTKALEDALNGV